MGLISGILYLFLSKSCEIRNQPKGVQLAYTVDTLIISDKDPIEANPFVLQIMPDVENESFFAYYPTIKKMKFFDITDNKILQEFSTKNLENEYGALQWAYYHKNDSIFLLFENSIGMISSAGKYSHVLWVNDSSRFDQRNYYVQARSKNQMGFYKGVLYLPVVYFGKNRYSKPVIASLNIREKKLNLIPITYPKNYQHKYYGYAEHNYFTIAEGNIAASFHCNDSIFVYKPEYRSVSIFDCKSMAREGDFISVPIKHRTDNMLKMESWMTTPFYADLTYDTENKVYYRIFYKEMPLKTEDGLFNTWSEKQIFLSVFNREFKLLGELNLPIDIFGYFFTVHKGCLYFLAGPKDSRFSDDSLQVIYKMHVHS